MSIHTEDPEIAMKFTAKPASRILVNTGGTQGGTGVSTGLAPSFTLGCGTMGGSSISDNVGPLHLINKKVLAYGTKDVTKLIEEDEVYQKYHGGVIKKDSGSLNISPEELRAMIGAVIEAMRK